MGITWIDPVDITPYDSYENYTEGFADLDLSNYIPSGTSGVILHIESGVAALFGVRKNGSTDPGYNATTLFNFSQSYMFCGVDEIGIIELCFISLQEDFETPDLVNARIQLIGYFSSDSAVFYTNTQIPIEEPVFGWTDIDLDVNDNAVGAIITTYLTGGPSPMAVRKNGSTDERLEPYTDQAFNLVTGVDENEVFEVYMNGDSVGYFLLGYIKGDSVVFNTNATNVSLNVSDTYQDITLPSGASGGFFEIITESNELGEPSGLFNYTLRKKNSPFSVYKKVAGRGFGFSSASNRIVEGKVESLDVDFYLTGYTEQTQQNLEGSAEVTCSSAISAAGKKRALVTVSASANTSVTATGKKGVFLTVSASAITGVVVAGVAIEIVNSDEIIVTAGHSVVVAGIKNCRAPPLTIFCAADASVASKKSISGIAVALSTAISTTIVVQKGAKHSVTVSGEGNISVLVVPKKGSTGIEIALLIVDGANVAAIKHGRSPPAEILTLGAIIIISKAVEVASGSVSISSSGEIATTGYKATGRDVALSTADQVVVAGHKAASADVIVSGVGVVTAEGMVIEGASGSVSIDCTGAIAAAGYKDISQGVTLAGPGQIAITGYKAAVTEVMVSVTGHIDTTGAAAEEQPTGTVQISGTGLITVTGSKQAADRAINNQPGRVTVQVLPGKHASAIITGVDAITVVGIANVSIITCVVDLRAIHNYVLQLRAIHNYVLQLRAIHNYVLRLRAIHDFLLQLNAEVIEINLAGGICVTAENQDFTMYIGDSKTLRFTVDMSEGATLAGAAIKWVMAMSKNILVTKEVGVGIEVDGDNIFTVTLDPVDTIGLRSGFYTHEVQITDVAGNVTTAARGRVTLRNDLIK